MSYTIESHQFAARDCVGGDPALDFINTVSGRDQTPRDWLDTYARLLEWAALVRLLPERNLRALTKKMHSVYVRDPQRGLRRASADARERAA